VTLKTVARRYAIALFDVLQKRGDQGTAERDLEGFRALLAGSAELTRVFENPAVPASKKRGIVEALLASSGGVSPEVRRLLLMLADRDRLWLLPEIADGYAVRLRKMRGIVNAELTTAGPLPASQRASLLAALARAAGSQVAMTEKVDPAIIGGVIARVGSVVFDGSVAAQLERMRRRLIDAGESAR
jgi:F-type H+-transporting ATPase subunit delta